MRADARADRKEINMASNKFNFKKVDMDYTGGGIYVLTGQMENGDWFIGGLEEDYVAFMDDDPWANDEQGFYNEWLYNEGHVKGEMSGKDSYDWFIEALTWVKENDPDSNYNGSDLEWHLNYYLNGGDEAQDEIEEKAEQDQDEDECPLSVETMTKMYELCNYLGGNYVTVDDDFVIWVKYEGTIAWNNEKVSADYAICCKDDDDAHNTLKAMLDGMELLDKVRVSH